MMEHDKLQLIYVRIAGVGILDAFFSSLIFEFVLGSKIE